MNDIRSGYVIILWPCRPTEFKLKDALFCVTKVV